VVGFRVRLVIQVAHSLLQSDSGLIFFLHDLNPLVRFYALRRELAVDQRHDCYVSVIIFNVGTT
jgi:hypothetical protein